MPKTQAQIIEEKVQERLLEMLTLVDPKLVVSLNKQGQLFIGAERATDAQLQNLKAEADFFKQSDLWKLLYETPKLLAHQAMFVLGEDMESLRKGRSMLFTLETQQKNIDTFASYTPKQ